MAKQQIKRLKEILAEVGMTGRYSMERAKTIREKRELARELGLILNAFEYVLEISLTPPLPR